MPLRVYKCETCGVERKTFKSAPEHCEKTMSKSLAAPQVTFLEPRDPEERRGKSVLKDQNKILLERSKAHSRDHELNDMIQEHGPHSAKLNKWINSNGVVRKKIDEI